MRAAIVSLWLSLASAPAWAQSPDVIQADRPGLADGSGVVSKGTIQVEAGVEWDRRTNEVTTFVPLLVRVGVARRIEARVEGSAFGADEAGGSWQNGIGAWSAGAKIVVLPEKKGRPQASVIARVFPPSGSGPFRSNVTTADIRLAADWNISDRWTLNPNVGAAWYDAEDGHYGAGLFAVTLGFEQNAKVQWFVDTGGQFPETADGTSAVTVDGGVAYVTKRNWQVDLSAGTRAHGDTPPRPFVAVGFSCRVRS